MNHPPIPPNFQFTRQRGEITDKWQWTIARNLFYEENPIERKVVSDSARCAWLDIAREICETEFNARPPLETDWKKFGETVQYRGALDNAEAWRLWGLK